MYGIPFKGLDLYTAVNGTMKGVLAKLFTLFNQSGETMNKASLVTFLSECLIIPNVAIQAIWHYDDGMIRINKLKITKDYLVSLAFRWNWGCTKMIYAIFEAVKVCCTSVFNMIKFNLRLILSIIILSTLIICITGYENNQIFYGSKIGNDNQFI